MKILISFIVSVALTCAATAQTVNIALNLPLTGSMVNQNTPSFVDGDITTVKSAGHLTDDYGNSVFKDLIFDFGVSCTINTIKIFQNDGIDHIFIYYDDNGSWVLAARWGISTGNYTISGSVTTSKLKLSCFDVGDEDCRLSEIEVWGTRHEIKIVYEYDDAGNRKSCTYESAAVLKSVTIASEDKNNTENQNLLNENIRLYPNPTDGIVKVYINKELEGPVNFSVYNMNGLLVQQAQYNGAIKEIDLSNEAPGTYYLKITAGNETVTQKIIKK